MQSHTQFMWNSIGKSSKLIFHENPNSVRGSSLNPVRSGILLIEKIQRGFPPKLRISENANFENEGTSK